MKMMNLLLFLGCASMTSLTWADEIGEDAPIFESTIQSFANDCRQMQCQGPHRANPVVMHEENPLLQDLYKTLSNVAFEQAQIWADTILEGDFYAAGQTRLDQVYALYDNDALIGYRIIYSEQAWDLSQCDYYQAPGQSREEALSSCPEGRIVEASFVSPTFTTFIRDSNQFAEFIARD